MPSANRCVSFFVLLLVCLLVSVGKAGHTDDTASSIRIEVDASTPWNRRIPARVLLPAKPGRFDLVYPGWLPGMHAVEGPIANVSRLTLRLDGKPLPWRRDPYNPFVIHTEIPADGQLIEASFDYVPPGATINEGFAGVVVTPSIVALNPSAFALAPLGNARACRVALHVRLPQGWTAATALARSPAPDTSADANALAFAPTSLYTLVDSPIMAGANHKTISLPTPVGDVPHVLDLFGETPAALKKEEIVTPLFRRLVAESQRLFGVRHYPSFHYLLALTPLAERSGLEHHASAIYVLQPEDLDSGPRPFKNNAWTANLIPHEFTHSWCGKYRRPYGENPHSNVVAQSSDLIWVYEGLTEYLGELLMVRAGFRPLEDWRNQLMSDAAHSHSAPNRDWQSLADAAITASYTYIHGSGTSLRNVSDIYYEGRLVWLEADMIIRRESGGKRSLDDFCRLFFGGRNRGAEVRTYTRRDVLTALRRTQSYDWETFLQKRVYKPPSGMLTQGLEMAGWRLEFGNAPDLTAMNSVTNSLPISLLSGPSAPFSPYSDYLRSVGIGFSPNGAILAVAPDSPAERAGLKSGMRLTGANGGAFSLLALRAAVRATRGSKTPLELWITEGPITAVSKPKSIRLEGVDGEGIPSLVRIPDTPDLLAAATSSNLN